MVAEYQQEVELSGHLIDSQILSKVWDKILEMGGDFEDLDFRLGKTNKDESYAKILVKGRSKEHLNRILNEINVFGVVTPQKGINLEIVKKDGVAPDNFYSTTNHPTFVFLGDEWIRVEKLRMDAMIVVGENAKKAFCKKLAKLKVGESVVVGVDGVRVEPMERPRKRGIFEFMASTVSSERDMKLHIRGVAKEMKDTKSKGGKIVFVVGPAVIHTGGDDALSEIIKMGYVSALLGGNAVAVHDIEKQLYGTSLGIDVTTGIGKKGGHKNHMRAINVVRGAGSIEGAIDKGILKGGIMYQLVKNRIPYVLAGSLRDDGPLPGVIMNMEEAQDGYSDAVKDADIVVMMASMLHSIATGNMLPANAKTVCVDINPAVVTKLVDRGTSQAIGMVTDVGLFLDRLRGELIRD
ncbi:MAG: TIGR00300 family protein [Candidatus Altiarchaeota archaeon]|nr:TIGR00300 family protein [Candidatus Altiarchaeota archaeon]